MSDAETPIIVTVSYAISMRGFRVRSLSANDREYLMNKRGWLSCELQSGNFIAGGLQFLIANTLIGDHCLRRRYRTKILLKLSDFRKNRGFTEDFESWAAKHPIGHGSSSCNSL